ncbi:MAG: methionyl-tRNA formyltransferase [Ruminococcaceae bacterium]|nr:methionyl-tRNA formyltransferase [Oscillospiraceae bacterium]
MKIMFMGTPEIAATCLEKLIDDGKEIAAVITREDKPRGRGNVMTPTPVKSLALRHGIEVYTPKTLRDEEFSALLSAISPDLIVVVAYGKILPKNVIDFPQYGCINAHVSLLPKYRGAAPMQRAIMEGESETGVTIMYMDEGLDTGDIILAESFPITENDDFESVHDRSAEVGARLLSKTVDAIGEGRATRIKQDDSLASYAKKVEKEDVKIDFTLDAKTVSCRIRGVTPIPGAFAYLNGKMLKLCKVKAVSASGKPGEVTDVNSSGEGSITVACGSGALLVSSVIPEGKGKMSAGDFVRGRKIKIGDILK